MCPGRGPRLYLSPQVFNVGQFGCTAFELVLIIYQCRPSFQSDAESLSMGSQLEMIPSVRIIVVCLLVTSEAQTNKDVMVCAKTQIHSCLKFGWRHVCVCSCTSSSQSVRDKFEGQRICGSLKSDKRPGHEGGECVKRKSTWGKRLAGLTS